MYLGLIPSNPTRTSTHRHRSNTCIALQLDCLMHMLGGQDMLSGGMRETVSNLLETKATGPWLQSLSIGTTIPLLVMYDGRDANMQPHVLGTCFRLGECVPARFNEGSSVLVCTPLSWHTSLTDVHYGCTLCGARTLRQVAQRTSLARTQLITRLAHWASLMKTRNVVHNGSLISRSDGVQARRSRGNNQYQPIPWYWPTNTMVLVIPPGIGYSPWEPS